MRVSKRIYWDNEDKRNLAERAYAIMNEPMFTGSKLDAIRQAQSEIMPAESHRLIYGMHQIKWAEPIWDAMKAKASVGAARERMAQRQTVIKPVTVPQVERDTNGHSNGSTEQRDADQLAQVAAHLSRTVEEAEPVSNLRDLGNLLESLGSELKRAVSSDFIRGLIRDEMGSLLRQMIPNLLTLEGDSIRDVSRPNVLIIGAKNDSQKILQNLVGDQVNLRFMHGDEPVAVIRSEVDKADLSIRTKWCKGTLGNTLDWPNFESPTGDVEEIQALILERFKLPAPQLQ